jgi:hypothetical protein
MQKGRNANISIEVIVNMNLNVGLFTQKRFARNTWIIKTVVKVTAMRDTLNSVHGLQVNMGAGGQTVSSLMLLMQAMMVMNALDVRIFGLI